MDSQELIRSNLKRLMEERGYTEHALSVAAAAGPTAVRDILKMNKRGARIDTLEKLAKTLNVTVLDLILEKDKAATANLILGWAESQSTDLLRQFLLFLQSQDRAPQPQLAQPRKALPRPDPAPHDQDSA